MDAIIGSAHPEMTKRIEPEFEDMTVGRIISASIDQTNANGAQNRLASKTGKGGTW